LSTGFSERLLTVKAVKMLYWVYLRILSSNPRRRCGGKGEETGGNSELHKPHLEVALHTVQGELETWRTSGVVGISLSWETPELRSPCREPGRRPDLPLRWRLQKQR